MPRGAVIAHVNVTAVRLAEEAAKSAYLRLAAMTAAVPGVVYQFVRAADGGWRFLSLSDGVQELFEMRPQEGLADHTALTHCILDEDRQAHIASVELSARNLSAWQHEHRIKTPSGKLK